MSSNGKKQLASGWREAPLGDMLTILRGVSYKKQDATTEPAAGKIPILRATNIDDGKLNFTGLVYVPQEYVSKVQLLNVGDIVIAASSGSRHVVGKAASLTVPWTGSFGAFCYGLRPHLQGTASYISLFLQTSIYRDHVSELSAGVNINNLRREHIEGVPLPVAPLNEQRRIVAKIEELFSELDKGVESLKTARAKLDVYRQAVLKHAFEGKLTAKWRDENKNKLETPEQLLYRIKQEREARYEQQVQEWKAAVKKWEEGGKSGKRPARSRMPKPVSTMAEEEIAHLESLPSCWQWLTAESVGVVQLGRQRSPKNRSKDYPTKYIRAANITEQGLDLDDVLDMDFRPHELSAYRLERGDLILAEASGSAAQVGKPAIWDDQIPNCCFQNTVIRHQPYCRDYAPYLLWLYRFLYVSGKFSQVAGGVGINHLSAFRFAQIALPLCSLAEQREIVRLLSERFEMIMNQEREIEFALKQAETLRQAILKKTFAGQLIPQDPEDEPASILLERIKAVKSAPSQVNKRTKRRREKATA